MRRHWRFAVVLAQFAGGAVAALWLAHAQQAPAYALASNGVYRVEVGAVLVGVGYASFVTLRLAWAGQTFTKFTAGPAGAEVSPAVESAAQDIDDLRDDVTALTGDLSLALERISARLERLEPEPPG